MEIEITITIIEVGLEIEMLCQQPKTLKKEGDESLQII